MFTKLPFKLVLKNRLNFVVHLSTLQLCQANLNLFFFHLQLHSAHGYWALLRVRLPSMASSQSFWFLCVREKPGASAVHQGGQKWLTISTYSQILPIWIQVRAETVSLCFIDDDKAFKSQKPKANSVYSEIFVVFRGSKYYGKAAFK